LIYKSRTDYSDDGCNFGNIDWCCGTLFDVKRRKQCHYVGGNSPTVKTVEFVS